MELFFILMREVGVMACVIALGVWTRRSGMMTEDVARRLSGLIIQIILPALLFYSFQQEKDPAYLSGFWASMVFAMVTLTLYVVIATAIYRSGGKSVHAKTNRLALVMPNCGFMGIPLLLATTGPKSIIYCLGVFSMFQLVTWCWAVPMMENRRPTLRQVFINPGVIAIIAGFLMFLLEIRLPTFATSFLTCITGLNTPLSMLMIGILLADLKPLSLLKNREIHIAVLWRNILLPLLTLLIIWATGLTQRFGIEFSLANLILLSCSCAASVLLLPLRTGDDSEYAAQVVAESTLLSILTMPLLILLAQKIL